jgi:hypothetical protein
VSVQIKFYRGTNTEGELVYTATGTSTPSSFGVTGTSSLYVLFSTDGSDTGSGFSFTYSYGTGAYVRRSQVQS